MSQMNLPYYLMCKVEREQPHWHLDEETDLHSVTDEPPLLLNVQSRESSHTDTSMKRLIQCHRWTSLPTECTKLRVRAARLQPLTMPQWRHLIQTVSQMNLPYYWMYKVVGESSQIPTTDNAWMKRLIHSITDEPPFPTYWMYKEVSETRLEPLTTNEEIFNYLHCVTRQFNATQASNRDEQKNIPHKSERTKIVRLTAF